MALQINWYKILNSPNDIEEGKTIKVEAGKKLLAASKVKGIIELLITLARIWVVHWVKG